MDMTTVEAMEESITSYICTPYASATDNKFSLSNLLTVD
jgi:hypothetical protein